jgi:hypothetical protein
LLLLLVLAFAFAFALEKDDRDGDADRTYTGTTDEMGHSALQTGQTRRLGWLLRTPLIPRLSRSSRRIPGSSHWNKQGQQYKCPHLVTTGSTTSSKQMLHENRLSVMLLLLLVLLAAVASWQQSLVMPLFVGIVVSLVNSQDSAGREGLLLLLISIAGLFVWLFGWLVAISTTFQNFWFYIEQE